MKISAHFATVDDAENCARRLKHSCGGIRSIRIRYHAVPNAAPSDTPEVIPPMAFPGTGSYAGEPGSSGAVFAVELGPVGENSDGPEGRLHCLMEVIAEPGFRREIESILLNSGGSGLYAEGAFQE